MKLDRQAAALDANGQSSGRRTGRIAGLAASIGVAMCALCCTAPLLIGAGIGSAALLAYVGIGEKVGMALLALSVVGYLIARYRRRHTAACSVHCVARPKRAT